MNFDFRFFLVGEGRGGVAFPFFVLYFYVDIHYAQIHVVNDIGFPLPCGVRNVINLNISSCFGSWYP